TSTLPLVSPGTRLSENDANATYRPSALIAGSSLSWFPCTPALLTLSSSVKPGAGCALAPVASTRAAAPAASAARQGLGICSSFVPRAKVSPVPTLSAPDQFGAGGLQPRLHVGFGSRPGATSPRTRSRRPATQCGGS